jgi:hypothetical protein
MNTTQRHPLYSAALAAQEHYTRTIETLFPGKTCWTLSKAQSAMRTIREAYDAKVSADAAWLAFLRESRTK